MIDDNVTKWLKSGTQSEVTMHVKNAIASIDGDGLQYVLNMMKYLKDGHHKADASNFKTLFRKRTAEEIILSDEIVGCSDYAVAFCALARGKGIPTIFVEMPEKSWVESDDTQRFANHDFCKIYINNTWYWVDPTRGNIGTQGPHNVGGDKEYVLFAEGLDSWDLGLKDWDSYTKKYLKFRDVWKSTNRVLI